MGADFKLGVKWPTVYKATVYDYMDQVAHVQNLNPPLPESHPVALAGTTTGTTVAVVVWLAAWAVLHAKWKRRDVAPQPVFVATLALIALGILFAFPPVWPRSDGAARAHDAGATCTAMSKPSRMLAVTVQYS